MLRKVRLLCAGWFLLGTGIGAVAGYWARQADCDIPWVGDHRRSAIWKAAQDSVLSRLNFPGSVTFPGSPARREESFGAPGLIPTSREIAARIARAEGRPEDYQRAKASDFSTSTITDYGSWAEVNSWVEAPNAYGVKGHLRFYADIGLVEGKWKLDKLEFLWIDDDHK